MKKIIILTVLSFTSSIAQSIVGMNKSILKDAKIFNYNGELVIRELPSEVKRLKILNAKAQIVLKKEIQAVKDNIDISNLDRGIYILQFICPKVNLLETIQSIS